MSKSASTTNALYVDPRQARLMGHQMGITGANRQELRLMESLIRKTAKNSKSNKFIFDNFYEAVARGKTLHKDQPLKSGFVWVVCEYGSYQYIVKLVKRSQIT